MHSHFGALPQHGLHSAIHVPAVLGVHPSACAASGRTAADAGDVPNVPNLDAFFEQALDAENDAGTNFTIPMVPDTERPCFRVYDSQTQLDDGKWLEAGVWFHTLKTTKAGVSYPEDIFVCGPLHVLSQTSDSSGNHFGRLLRFLNTAGAWREWSMPMELLKGDGTELRGELLAMGLSINRKRPARTALRVRA